MKRRDFLIGAAVAPLVPINPVAAPVELWGFPPIKTEGGTYYPDPKDDPLNATDLNQFALEKMLTKPIAD